MDTNIHKGISQLVQVSRSRGSARCVGPAMTSNTRESGVQTTVHAVATRAAAFKTVQCNELNVTALYILITKQIDKEYKYYSWCTFTYISFFIVFTFLCVISLIQIRDGQ